MQKQTLIKDLGAAKTQYGTGGGRMLRILHYLCTKSGKISTRKGGGLILRPRCILRILQ